jgi:hypothetical protein
VTGELLFPQRDDRLLLDEIERAPVRPRGRAEHEQMRAGIVRDDLGCSRADEIRKPRIRNSDRRMQRGNGIDNLAQAVGRRSRRQIGLHAKREFGLGDAHFISRH